MRQARLVAGPIGDLFYSSIISGQVKLITAFAGFIFVGSKSLFLNDLFGFWQARSEVFGIDTIFESLGSCQEYSDWSLLAVS